MHTSIGIHCLKMENCKKPNKQFFSFRFFSMKFPSTFTQIVFFDLVLCKAFGHAHAFSEKFTKSMEKKRFSFYYHQKNRELKRKKVSLIFPHYTICIRRNEHEPVSIRRKERKRTRKKSKNDHNHNFWFVCF